MADCPKCKQKIPFYHISQNCPHCGVNMRFYDFDKRFYHDAKEAELSNAKINVFIAKLKASLIGGTLPILRLCFLLLPIVALLVPFGNMTFSFPFGEDKIALSGLGLFTAFQSGYMDIVPALMKASYNGATFKALLFPIGSYVLMVLCILLLVILTILCFASIEKMPKALCTFSVIGAATSVASVFLLKNLASKAAFFSEGIISSVTLSFGAVVAVLAFAAVFIVNFLIIQKGLSLEFKEGDLERIEIAKKVKSGEIKLDDLPHPIVETAETRAIDEEIARQQRTYREKEEVAR